MSRTLRRLLAGTVVAGALALATPASAQYNLCDHVDCSVLCDLHIRECLVPPVHGCVHTPDSIICY
jgi:hypothetical protein